MVFARQKHDSETITLTSIHDSNNLQPVERIDLGKEERLLVIRLPLTGDMTLEKNYRKKELLDFSKTLYKALLSTYDTHIVYQSLYKAIAKYQFPVTTFMN